MSKASNKSVYQLPDHSLAKIDCYRKYLDIYLAVLANTLYQRIYILDLFAGEGRDVHGKACSSIAAIEALKTHYDSDQTKCRSVTLFLNDSGNSVIEKSTKKIDRVKRIAEEIVLPSCVKKYYTDKPFEELIPKVIQRLNKLQANEKALCFIDPFGYKYSKPETIKDLLDNGNTEVLLFIPISFMHRFAAKSLRDESFTEGKHIEEFVSALFEENVPDIKSQVSFIKSIKDRFRTFLGIKYVDVMYIEKDKGQYFALYFFSNSKRGFQKMLEAKWTIDEENGHGFAVKKSSISPTLFDNIDHEDYSYILLNELTARKIMTNQELFDFGLDHNHLPKHTKRVLDELKRTKMIEVVTQDGAAARGYYLEDNHTQKILIKKL